MSHVERPGRRFVRALLAGGEATRDSCGMFVAPGPVKLDDASVRALVSAGLVTLSGDSCRAAPPARAWLRRQMIDEDAFAAQHRIDVRRPDGTRLNLAESPLARLASSVDGEKAFLDSHQVEAGERVRRLAERAQLQQRVTMSYSSTRTAGSEGQAQAAEISDMAADARRALAELHRVLPADCAGVVLDVCGLLKGLQLVESERGWPRRSAKLVLRIGLEQLAQHYGLGPMAVGAETRRRRSWLGEGARPDVFG